jgi:hypothetical protein
LTINKFIDIASHFRYNISVALSVNNVYYVWNKCGEEKIEEPKETELKSFDDIFIHYFEITYKVSHINFEQNIKSKKMIKESESEENVGKRSETESNETLKEFENLIELPKLETDLLLKLLNEKPNSVSNAEFNEFKTGSLKYDRYKSEFEELKFIGGGGFGKFYKVINCLDQQQYAVKIISFKGTLFRGRRLRLLMK